LNSPCDMKKGIAFAAAVILVITSITLWQISRSRTFQFFGELIPRIKTTQKRIALSTTGV
jgi:peptidoglycan-N-acetylglucosamine deacetylase